MALRDMAKFMAEHRGELVAAADHGQQAQVQAQVATRQSKCVDGAVTSQQDLPGKSFVQLRTQVATKAGRRQQGLPDVLYIVAQNGIVKVIRVAVQLAHNSVTQASLFVAAHLAAITQQRQIGRCTHCNGLAASRLGMC